MREAGGFRMGPFELMDLIGHDVNFAVTRSVYEALLRRSALQAVADAEGSGRCRLARPQERARILRLSEARRSRPRRRYCPGSGPRPEQVVIEGDLGAGWTPVDLARSAGLTVEHRRRRGRLAGGRLAAGAERRSHRHRARGGWQGDVVLFDLALDYASCSRDRDRRGGAGRSGRWRSGRRLFPALGKQVSVLADIPGLAVIRTVAMLVNEAADAVHQGIAPPEDVDAAMQKGVNYPRGPLAWVGTIGLAWIVQVIDQLARTYKEDRYRTSPLLRRYALAARSFHLNLEVRS